MAAASQKAGAYFSSWGTWAAEKRRTGWGKSESSPPSPLINQKEFSQVPTSNDMAKALDKDEKLEMKKV
jgi:hypothetical protein